MVTKEELIAFEEDIAQCFNEKQIRAPIHLYHGNEDQIIQIFKLIGPNDYVCATWRNHYQALLKGVPKDELKRRILNGKSMVMCIPEYKIVCSSIVGGIPSIATGIAWAEKMKGEGNHVWCFIGDMSAATGAFNEAWRYSIAHDLPITFVIEDNKKSVETPTEKVWKSFHPANKFGLIFDYDNGLLFGRPVGYLNTLRPHIIYYCYTNTKFPHAGAGQRISF